MYYTLYLVGNDGVFLVTHQDAWTCTSYLSVLNRHCCGFTNTGVFGLGAVGLAVVQAAKMAGAAKIYAIDTNAAKFGAAVDLGATDCVNPSELGDKPVQQHLVEE